MEKTITITMNQLDGTIDYEHDGKPTYAEALAMIEYTKLMISRDWLEETREY